MFPKRAIYMDTREVCALQAGALTVVHRLVVPPRGYEMLIDPDEHELRGVAKNCPWGRPGEALLVKETWARLTGNGHRIVYRADGVPMTNDPPTGRRVPVSPMTWTSAVRMPREFCRFAIEVTDVRVERLQSVTEADAVLEGFVGGRHPAALEEFSMRWHDEEKAPWSTNPWVYRIALRPRLIVDVNRQEVRT
jgi:hypothetical protein